MPKTNKERKEKKVKLKRLNKRVLTEMLTDLFLSKMDKVWTLKEIFRVLHLTTHNYKMLTMDIIEDMEMEGVLTHDTSYHYRLTDRKKMLECPNDDTVMHAILSEYNLPTGYPERMEAAAAAIPAEITDNDIALREDFRGVFTFTIDPIDAKDFDDALSIRELKKGQSPLYEVGVHIADVSHYVQEGTLIDKEARARATSVYLVDRTIPMLPERLCNNICSLRPDEDKLCFSVVFTMNEKAEVKDYRIARTIIRSQRRYAYEEVQEIIEKAEEPSPLLTLHQMAQQLRKRRMAGGAINFDREELRFETDATGHPIRCYFHRSTDANKLIEEFMLLANRTVAEHIGKQKGAKTFVYRVHEDPDPDKLLELSRYVSKFGYKLKMGDSLGQTSSGLNSLIADCAGKSEEKLVQLIALRAMMKAKYSIHNVGHFGLAFPYYTHFTSPIRRYPDIMVHRLLTRYLANGRSVNSFRTEEQCKHCSEMELLAATAERDSIKYKMVEFMADFLGETFQAHISGIQQYGIYCEIDENHCEGMIPLRDLDDDYYELDERNFCLVGRTYRNRFRLGDPITIRVAQADLQRRRLDFSWVHE